MALSLQVFEFFMCVRTFLNSLLQTGQMSSDFPSSYPLIGSFSWFPGTASDSSTTDGIVVTSTLGISD